MKKIAVLHDKGDYGKGLAEFAKDFLEKDPRAEVVFYEGITPGAVDYSAVVQKIKRSEAEAVIFGGYHPEASKLVQQMRKEDPHLPALMQSSDLSNASLAEQMGVGFLHKYSKSLSLELRNFIIRHFAFGEFIFRDPETMKEVARAVDLQALQQRIMEWGYLLVC